MVAKRLEHGALQKSPITTLKLISIRVTSGLWPVRTESALKIAARCSTQTAFAVEPADGWTYHPDRKVVVDNVVGDRVTLLLLVIRDNVDVPAIQDHFSAVFDVPQELQQAAALVACREPRQSMTMFNQLHPPSYQQIFLLFASTGTSCISCCFWWTWTMFLHCGHRY